MSSGRREAWIAATRPGGSAGAQAVGRARQQAWPRRALHRRRRASRLRPRSRADRAGRRPAEQRRGRRPCRRRAAVAPGPRRHCDRPCGARGAADGRPRDRRRRHRALHVRRPPPRACPTSPAVIEQRVRSVLRVPERQGRSGSRPLLAGGVRRRAGRRAACSRASSTCLRGRRGASSSSSTTRPTACATKPTRTKRSARYRLQAAAYALAVSRSLGRDRSCGACSSSRTRRGGSSASSPIWRARVREVEAAGLRLSPSAPRRRGRAGRRPRARALGIAEQRAAGDEDVGAGADGAARRSSGRCRRRPRCRRRSRRVDHPRDLGDLRLHRGDVVLPAEARVDRHHEHHGRRGRARSRPPMPASRG